MAEVQSELVQHIISTSEMMFELLDALKLHASLTVHENSDLKKCDFEQLKSILAKVLDSIADYYEHTDLEGIPANDLYLTWWLIQGGNMVKLDETINFVKRSDS